MITSYIWGNENRIAQVFDNLIQNAASFSNHNCRIDIRLEKNSEKIIILVEDNGPGFSEIGMQKYLIDSTLKDLKLKNLETILD